MESPRCQLTISVYRRYDHAVSPRKLDAAVSEDLYVYDQRTLALAFPFPTLRKASLSCRGGENGASVDLPRSSIPCCLSNNIG